MSIDYRHNNKPETGERTEMKVDIRYLMKALIKYKASDLHLKVGRPPLFRINGKLVPAKMNNLSPQHNERLVKSLLNKTQWAQLEEKKQIDLSFQLQDLGRFRCNIYYQRSTVSAAVRLIPSTIPRLEDLGVPDVAKEVIQRKRGLVLLTGATGNGKSTTMAAMIQYLNEHQHSHVITIEDPIEFVFRDLKCSISQREVGTDASNIQSALHSSLRQDPDVIVIGEMRDAETIQAALTASETGHLVVSTLHTSDAKSSVDRIVDVFPADRQNQVRMQLASNLAAVFSQRLVRRQDGQGQALASEVLIKSPRVEELIMRNEIDKISEVIRTSSEYYKMQSMNASLEKLIRSGAISQEEGLRASSSPDDLKLTLSGMVREEGYQV